MILSAVICGVFAGPWNPEIPGSSHALNGLEGRRFDGVHLGAVASRGSLIPVEPNAVATDSSGEADPAQLTRPVLEQIWLAPLSQESRDEPKPEILTRPRTIDVHRSLPLDVKPSPVLLFPDRMAIMATKMRGRAMADVGAVFAARSIPMALASFMYMLPRDEHQPYGVILLARSLVAAAIGFPLLSSGLKRVYRPAEWLARRNDRQRRMRRLAEQRVYDAVEMERRWRNPRIRELRRAGTGILVVSGLTTGAATFLVFEQMRFNPIRDVGAIGLLAGTVVAIIARRLTRGI